MCVCGPPLLASLAGVFLVPARERAPSPTPAQPSASAELTGSVWLSTTELLIGRDMLSEYCPGYNHALLICWVTSYTTNHSLSTSLPLSPPPLSFSSTSSSTGPNRRSQRDGAREREQERERERERESKREREGKNAIAQDVQDSSPLCNLEAFCNDPESLNRNTLSLYIYLSLSLPPCSHGGALQRCWDREGPDGGRVPCSGGRGLSRWTETWLSKDPGLWPLEHSLSRDDRGREREREGGRETEK